MLDPQPGSRARAGRPAARRTRHTCRRTRCRRRQAGFPAHTACSPWAARARYDMSVCQTASPAPRLPIGHAVLDHVGDDVDLRQAGDEAPAVFLHRRMIERRRTGGRRRSDRGRSSVWPRNSSTWWSIQACRMTRESGVVDGAQIDARDLGAEAGIRGLRAHRAMPGVRCRSAAEPMRWPSSGDAAASIGLCGRPIKPGRHSGPDPDNAKGTGHSLPGPLHQTEVTIPVSYFTATLAGGRPGCCTSGLA